MTYEEFRAECAKIRVEAEEKRSRLCARYAIEHSTVKAGDIVIDHVGAVKVEKILIDRSNDTCCVYEGPEYTQKGAPFKNGSRRKVWQRDLKQVRK